MSALAAVLGHRVLVRAAQILVGAMLGWAALGKLGDIPALARDVHHFRLAPIAMENWIAMTLPWIELTAAASLLLGLRARAGSLVAAALLGVFTAAVVLALARGLDIACGCFGTAAASHVGTAKLLENVAWLGLAVVGVLPPRPASRTHLDTGSRARM